MFLILCFCFFFLCSIFYLNFGMLIYLCSYLLYLHLISDTHISASHKYIQLAETKGNFIMLVLKCKKKRSNPFKLDYVNIMKKMKVHMVFISSVAGMESAPHITCRQGWEIGTNSRKKHIACISCNHTWHIGMNDTQVNSVKIYSIICIKFTISFIS